MATVLMKSNINLLLEPTVGDAVLIDLRGGLLQLLNNTTWTPKVLIGIGTVINALARETITKDKDWPQLIPQLLVLCTQASLSVQGTAIELIGAIAQYGWHVVEPHLAGLCDVIQRVLTIETVTADASAVQMSAITCLGDLAHTADGEDLPPAVRTALPALVEPSFGAVIRAFRAGHHEQGISGLSMLTTIVSETPAIFGGGAQLSGILTVLLSLATAAELPTDARHVSIECMLQLMQAKKKSSRALPEIVNGLSGLLFRMLLHPEAAAVAAGDEPDEWERESWHDTEIEVCDYTVARDGFVRLSGAVGGKAFGEPLAHLFNALVDTPDTQVDSVAPGGAPLTTMAPGDFAHVAGWRLRHASLVTISAVAAGCKQLYTPYLPALAARVHARLLDPNRRVVAAALRCVVEFGADWSPQYPRSHHETALPLLLAIAHPQSARPLVGPDGQPGHHPAAASVGPSAVAWPAPCLVELALAGVQNILSDLTREMVSPARQDELVLADTACLGSDVPFVVLQAMVVMTCVAELLGEGFKGHYHNLREPLLRLIRNTAPKTHVEQQMRGKAYELLSIACQVLGDAFRDDALAILFDVAACTPQPPAELPQTSSGGDDGGGEGDADGDADGRAAGENIGPWMLAVGRLAALLREGFAPVVPTIVPALVRIAGQAGDVHATSDIDELSDKSGAEIMTLTHGRDKEQYVQLHTAIAEEKDTALMVLSDILAALPTEALAPYVGAIAQPALAALNGLNSVLAEAALRAVMHLLRHGQAVLPPEQYLELVARSTDALVEEFKTGEGDAETSAQLYDTLGALLRKAPAGAMSGEVLDYFGGELIKALGTVVGGFSEQPSADPEADDEELQAKIISETGMGVTLNEAIAHLLAVHVPFRDKYVSHCLPLYRKLLASKDPQELTFALMALIDFVEHVAPAAPEYTAPFAQQLIEQFVRLAPDLDVHVRSDATYGLGLCAANFPDASRPVLGAMIATVHRVISEAPQYETALLGAVKANACGALMRIYGVHHATSADVVTDAATLAVVLDNLPIQSDPIEARFIHGGLLALAAAGHAFFDAARLQVLAARLALATRVDINDSDRPTVEALLQKYPPVAAPPAPTA